MPTTRPKRADLLRALAWIRENLFRQDAATTATYWQDQQEYPCEEARAALEIATCSLKPSTTLTTALRKTGLLELYYAFRTGAGDDA